MRNATQRNYDRGGKTIFEKGGSSSSCRKSCFLSETIHYNVIQIERERERERENE